jgi:branched-chain amino acid transport system substrate-binding protein
MVKHLRWTALFAILALVLAACTGDGGTEPSTAASAAQSVGEDPTAVCDADEFGCAEIAPGADITLGTALVITTADADLGQDSQYGAQLAGDLRNALPEGGVKGHPIEWDHQDDECSADGGTNAARALVADTSIVAIIGTSC